MMVIQNILLSVVSNFVVVFWDGLDECEISQPEILSQSAPDLLYILLILYSNVTLSEKLIENFLGKM